MNDIDDKILEALSSEDRERLDDYAEEPGLFNLIFESFRSRMRWLVIFVFLFKIVFLGLAVWCAYEFFTATIVTQKLNWMVGLILSFLVFSLLRLWYFLELNRLSLSREIKRLELQVSLLTKKRETSDRP